MSSTLPAISASLRLKPQLLRKREDVDSVAKAAVNAVSVAKAVPKAADNVARATGTVKAMATASTVVANAENAENAAGTAVRNSAAGSRFTMP